MFGLNIATSTTLQTQIRLELKQLDINSDGIVEGKEWDRAVQDVEQEIDDQILQRQKLHHNSPETHILRTPDDKRLPFLVSAYQEPLTISVFIRFMRLWAMITFIALSLVVAGLLSKP